MSEQRDRLVAEAVKKASRAWTDDGDAADVTCDVDAVLATLPSVSADVEIAKRVLSILKETEVYVLCRTRRGYSETRARKPTVVDVCRALEGRYVPWTRLSKRPEVFL